MGPPQVVVGTFKHLLRHPEEEGSLEEAVQSPKDSSGEVAGFRPGAFDLEPAHLCFPSRRGGEAQPRGCSYQKGFPSAAIRVDEVVRQGHPKDQLTSGTAEGR